MKPSNPYRQNSKQIRKSAWIIVLSGTAFILSGIVAALKDGGSLIGGLLAICIGAGLARYGLQNVRPRR